MGSFLMVCLMIGTLNSTNILFSSETDGSCKNKLGTDTYVLSGLIVVKTVLTAIVCVALTSQYFNFRRTNLSRFRVVLRRMVCITRTMTSKVMYTFLLVSDLVTLVCIFLCLPMRDVAHNNCRGFYEIFMLMLFVYQMIVFVRLPMMFCLFIYG